MSRYEGKPFLRLIDCYVLSSIGHLDEKQENTLNMMAPKIAAALGISGSWFEMVEVQMGFPSDLPLKIKQIWDNGKAKAEASGYTVDPEQFAREFVDTNFPT
ncbi:MAG: hypothetical protein JWN66_1835 [Sphingomonas bacterium]|uniref:hypothetical protein n=1 Tax=Sphingomonas bacterium TaxID=1895847 RepID=UPI0026188FAB|nr:hypothetical protein [Sphingomonas bacterium]MDB5704719.1 hypothetical protein [Sphingomonas bacterium]